jgi:DNA-binding NarL/FixJ family response regulator
VPAGAAAGRCDGVAPRGDYYRDAGLPLLLAHTLEDAATLLAEHGQQPAARTAYTEATTLYASLGADWDLLRADTRLRPYGLRRHTIRRHRPSSGWEALTPAELKITALVAAGNSNPDIAAELFLSRRTVEVHVSHILTKLDARSRVEIARLAAEH